MPVSILKGKVIANAIGMYKPGSDLGTGNFMAAGIAIWEALAAKTASSRRSGSWN